MKAGWKASKKSKWMTGILMAGLLSSVGMMSALAAEGTLEAPESAGWSKQIDTQATWKKVKDATGYQLRLYFDEDYIQTVQVSGTKADLSEYMTREGWYYYEVRAIAANKSGVKYMDSSEYTVSDDKIIEDLGDTDGKWKNYVEGKKYQRDNGTYVVNGWYKILGDWYYFDENGYVATGWKQVGSTWYYMDQNGEMQTGWLQDDGKTYYLNTDGSMKIGWMQANPSQWYYFQADGSMAVDTVVDGYQINSSGLWIK